MNDGLRRFKADVYGKKVISIQEWMAFTPELRVTILRDIESLKELEASKPTEQVRFERL